MKTSETEEQAAGGQFNLTLHWGHISFFVVPRRAFLSHCYPNYLLSPTCPAQEGPATLSLMGRSLKSYWLAVCLGHWRGCASL